ncbi:putative HLH transcription factor [Aspergillus steynii IBT 23096]|uniref:Putative HLH transcription factor n=1 Tax=Aspergillus steynii IBT 23096 TaxID=1392250 RepID=A0A2I2FTP2_9EURO|nr:putative HLH transcription factor [Aspergillus steynii IBT 23096]PLB43971.1 putative HLH transcription factor [Aspergillus steynii IBT 23096]
MTETSIFIKSDPDEHNSDHFMMSHSGYMSNQFGNTDGVDPSELTMQNGGFMSYPFGSQQNMSSSFNFGNSGIDTDELLDLEINGHNNGIHRADSMNFLQDQTHSSAGISMSHPGQMSQMYSNTPEGAPMHSPFMHNSFNYDQFRAMNQQGQQSAPHMQSAGSHFEQSYLNGKTRPSLQAVDRSADGRSPMTPKTPALGALTLGTPESGSFPTQPIRTGLQHRHQKTLSNQWDGTPGSAHSYVESPISSPSHPHHAGISEILKSGKHASLPAKVDGHMPGSAQDLESQEAKRRRRRASHNLVERRRRDNINERIQDLSHLVPQHRLEDDKVRKQLVNNTTMSAAGANPNAATSLLAGGNGRRATAGNITMGLPIEEKEKGPNKGDILNGAVGWMRDLMWALHVKHQQEAELAELISSLGGTWPFEQTEEEKRMRTEILDALEKNDPSSFSYSRAPGTGLRVPKHTNMAGDAVSGNGALSPQSLSPSYNSGASTNSGGAGQAQYWSTSGHAGMSFKEEDEYAMEMN